MGAMDKTQQHMQWSREWLDDLEIKYRNQAEYSDWMRKQAAKDGVIIDADFEVIETNALEDKSDGRE